MVELTMSDLVLVPIRTNSVLLPLNFRKSWKNQVLISC